jgi:ribosomal protein S2
MISGGKVEFLVSQLLKNYCHIGYNSSLANSNSSGYLLGNYYGITIINIYKTFIYVRNALIIIKNILFLNGSILFMLNIKRPKKLRFNFFNVKFLYSKYTPGVISNFRSIEENKKKSKNLK